MSDIKSVVGLLSKILNNFFNINLKAEHFRLAKYDKEDENIVPMFWNVLGNCCEQNDNKNVVLNVKLHFASLAYKNVEFYSLPENMSEGSRELLLAFSWLLYKEKILDTVLKKELTKSELNKEYSFKFLNSGKPNETIPKLSTIEDFYNYTLWLSGKINNNLKHISEYQTKTSKLVDKVHKDTHHPKNLSNLSITETTLIRNHDQLRTYLHKIQKVSQMLDFYYKWKSKESFYWEWMLTVIKEKEKDKSLKINFEIIEEFFIELRNHVKNMLTKNIRHDETMILENCCPRIIYSPVHETNLLRDKQSLKKNQEEHAKHLKEISIFLKMYSSKKPT